MHIRIVAVVADFYKIPDAVLNCGEHALISFSQTANSTTMQIEVDEPDEITDELRTLAGFSTKESTIEWFRAQLSLLRVRLEEVAHILMWRIGASYAQNEYQIKEISISDDSVNWRPLPIDLRGISAAIIGPAAKIPDAQILASVEQLANQQQAEPLSHQLLREAWKLKKTSLRSALVLAVAAAEVGIKSYITARIPDTEWLIENIQSPPIDRLFSTYLEKVPPELHFKNRSIRPPASLIKTLKNSVELRNRVVHQGTSDVTPEIVDSTLKAIRDLLYILDFYGGLQWAAEIISYETIASWK